MHDQIEDGTWTWNVDPLWHVSRRGSGFEEVEVEPYPVRFSCDGVLLETTDTGELIGDPKSVLARAKEEAPGRFWSDRAGREWYVQEVPPPVAAGYRPLGDRPRGTVLDTAGFAFWVPADGAVDVEELSDDELQGMVDARYYSDDS